MKIEFKNIDKLTDNVAVGAIIDLSGVDFMDPWAVVWVCLKLVNNHGLEDKAVKLPVNNDLLCYLKRIHFGSFLSELGYAEESGRLKNLIMPERENINVQELVHCNYRDEFDGRLGRFIQMFGNFGLNSGDATLAATLVGELGNNSFDHNLGSWPTDISGNIIIAQNYPKLKKIQIVVGDPGVGFLGSMRPAFPELSSDLEAIEKGLSGFTGRIDERRGNGLRLIQEWTIKNFYGTLSIQSGTGLINVSAKGMKKTEVKPILGTMAQLMIEYR
ncbi:MAG: hypothetical protein WC745_01240 [Patescibacteria group bacterium]